MGEDIPYGSRAGQVDTGTLLFDRKIYKSRLNTRSLGRTLVALEETESTNSHTSSLFEKKRDRKLAVVAESQTAGRGRFGRKWESAPGKSLTFSFAWPVSEGFISASPGLATLAAGVAIAEAVREVSGAKALLKYPNDLYLNDKKAGGILTELKKSEAGRYIVIGLGVNVNNQATSYESEYVQNIAVSIMEAAGKSVSREEIMAEFFNRIEPLLEALENGGSAPVVSRYRKLSNTVGREVMVTLSGQELCGIVTAITDKGELALDVSGERKLLMPSEVSFKKSGEPH